ncbi:MAG: hypothetical protein ACRCTR_04845 [Actinomycetota bacterium]
MAPMRQIATRIAARTHLATPRCGFSRVVAIDGRSGAGKTTLAAALSTELSNAPVLAMDEIYPGWDGLSAGAQMLVEDVLTPLAHGHDGRWRTHDWQANRPGPTRVVTPSPVLIIEGCGAGNKAATPYLSLLVWVDCPDHLRRQRALARDGSSYGPHWRRWADQEEHYAQRDKTAERADLRVDLG